MSKKAGIITLGCKVNQYESEALSEALFSRGFTVADENDVCDCYIINTCTVTAEADRKSKQMIRRAARLNPNAAIVVTGCTAEYAAQELSQIEGVIAVCGNAKKLECVDILEKYFSEETLSSPIVSIPPICEAEFEKMHLKAFPRTRVYIKIEDGCENKCAYCAIPKARGNVRSKLPEDVLREVIGFINAGCREIVLTGIETASYGKDLEHFKLGGLLRLVDAVAGDCKIRLGSLDPSLFKESFVNGIKDLRSFAPHFHISLQSGSSHVLALMRRKYNAEGARAALARLREAIPGVMFTTDIIVGFPGETDEDFRETVEFVKEARFLTAHIFPYSEREGTPAAEMEGSIPVDIRRERAAALTEIQNSVRDSLLEEIVSASPEVNVLFETYSNGIAHGHTDNFLEVSVESKADLHGQIHAVRLTRHENGICFGTFVAEPVIKQKPLRPSGTISGFRTGKDDQLKIVINELVPDADIDELHELQNIFRSIGRDPTVPELHFMLAGHRNAKKRAYENILASSAQISDPEIRMLWSDLVRNCCRNSPDPDSAPSLLTLAQYAASGRIGSSECGISLSRESARTAPPVYSGSTETIRACELALNLSTGKPISGKKAGNTAVLLAPPEGCDIDAFYKNSSLICRRYLEKHPETLIIPASAQGLLFDIAQHGTGWLFDASLLPMPALYAEAVFAPQAPALIVFADREGLPLLWQIAGEYGITPCAPAAAKPKNITVRSKAGDVEFERTAIAKLEMTMNAVLCCDAESTLNKCDPIEKDLECGQFVSMRNVGGGALYEDIAAAMSDQNAVYAISGTLNADDPSLIPALITLDSYRRNHSPRVVFSEFFIGKNTTVCIIKLCEKK